MKRKSTYAGIDYFRVISAILVVSIHTSPLSAVNDTADFILTRVLARIAVPFFFMASGFFLFPETETGKLYRNKLAAFIKKTAALYAVSILLYLPLNIYTGSIKDWRHLPELLKDIFFDGTFYHLWYLPAAITGAAITWLLLKRLKAGQALGISLLLYIVGLFGDSYYGIAEKAPSIKLLYQGLFTFSDYTRNGLFLAPVFFILGAILARRAKPFSFKICLTGLAASGTLMLAEGLLLRRFGVQRHDSMYFMLLPCMFFLFQSLLFWKGEDLKNLRSISMLIYLIHPLMIVLVRGFAKVTGLQRLLIDNSLLHFAAVAGTSFVSAAVFAMLLQEKHSDKAVFRQNPMGRAWAEINMLNLGHNVQALRKALPGECEIMAVVKANAYGHGSVEVAKYLSRIGIHAFAVATIDEGIHLRRQGIKGEILILGYTAPQRASELFRHHLSQTVIDSGYAESLNDFGKPVKVHIKVDTGMHRLGESCNHVTEIAHIFRCGNLKIDGIFTHLCVSDSAEPDDIAFSKAQIQKFYSLLSELKEHGFALPKTHIQSSYGILNYPELQCGYARVGIALYGTFSTQGVQTKTQADLLPVLSLKARVALVRTIEAGESVGYGHQFTASENMQIAVLSIGYADGYPRSLSCGKGKVLLNGHQASIIGQICMDQLMVDITGLPNVQQGDIATLIGKDGAVGITAEQVAFSACTITNELLSRLSSRLERVYLGMAEQ